MQTLDSIQFNFAKKKFNYLLKLNVEISRMLLLNVGQNISGRFSKFDIWMQVGLKKWLINENCFFVLLAHDSNKMFSIKKKGKATTTFLANYYTTLEFYCVILVASKSSN